MQHGREVVAQRDAHGGHSDVVAQRVSVEAEPTPQGVNLFRGVGAPDVGGGEVEDEFTVENQRILKEKHLKLRLRRGEMRIDAIQFNFATQPGNRTRAAYRLAINEYNGVQSTQLMIEHFENR